MTTIIAGSRSITDPAVIAEAVAASGIQITHVISGSAPGADRAGEAWALAARIPLSRYPAPWGTAGKRAGIIRNHCMASLAEALVAVWDGQSRGTRHMIAVARKQGLRVHVHQVAQANQPELILH